jgi:hypothetical protein
MMFLHRSFAVVVSPSDFYSSNGKTQMSMVLCNFWSLKKGSSKPAPTPTQPLTDAHEVRTESAKVLRS